MEGRQTKGSWPRGMLEDLKTCGHRMHVGGRGGKVIRALGVWTVWKNQDGEKWGSMSTFLETLDVLPAAAFLRFER